MTIKLELRATSKKDTVKDTIAKRQAKAEAAMREKFRNIEPTCATVFLVRHTCLRCHQSIITGSPSPTLLKYERQADPFRTKRGRLQSGGTESWSRPVAPALIPAGLPIHYQFSQVKTQACPYCCEQQELQLGATQ